MRSFFHKHHLEPWFEEKYGISVFKQKAQSSLQRSEEFAQNYKPETLAITYENFCKMGEVDEHNANRIKVKEDASQTILIKSIPLDISFEELQQGLKISDSPFECEITDPNPQKYMSRIGFVKYDLEDDYQNMLTKGLISIRGSQIQFEICSTRIRNYMITPSNIDENEIDFKLALEMIKVFDKRVGIEANPLLDCEFNEENLDRLVFYLRYVHFYCYYCSRSYPRKMDLLNKCGIKHFRCADDKKEGEWVLNVRSRNQENIDTDKEDFTLRIEELKKKKMGEIMQHEKLFAETGDGVFSCKECLKKFRSVEFIQKHFEKRHEEAYLKNIDQAKKESLEEMTYEIFSMDNKYREKEDNRRRRSRSPSPYRNRRRYRSRSPYRKRRRSRSPYRELDPRANKIINYTDLDNPDGDKKIERSTTYYDF